MRHSTTGNKRANGQAEVVIRVLKAVVRRLMTEDPSAYWSDAIPAALQCLRMAPTKAHGFPPFTVVTGAFPVLPA